ncbi:MAG: hypothetical protein R6V10_00875 [bacterium]
MAGELKDLFSGGVCEAGGPATVVPLVPLPAPTFSSFSGTLDLSPSPAVLLSTDDPPFSCFSSTAFFSPLPDWGRRKKAINTIVQITFLMAPPVARFNKS